MEEKKEGGAVKESFTSDTLIQNLSNDYAAYMDLEYTKEKENFEENIDELLTRLDEYVGLVDIIRSDTTLCLSRTLPTIQEKSDDMEAICNKIDKLEMYVAMVKSNVSQMEAEVDQAEADLGSFSTVKKFLSAIPMPSFLSSKKTPKVQSPVKAKYTGPTIFETKDYVMPLEHKSDNTRQESPLKQEEGAQRPELNTHITEGIVTQKTEDEHKPTPDVQNVGDSDIQMVTGNNNSAEVKSSEEESASKNDKSQEGAQEGSDKT